jgi:RimJ/RimL family protein N-acetyltransferase
MALRAAASGWMQDAFLGEILGKAVYRLSEPTRAGTAIQSLSGQQPWMMEAKVSVEAPESMEALYRLGFQVIDTNTQLDCPVAALTLRPVAPEVSVRAARAEDRRGVERIAAENLTTSRFHLDWRIAPELASRIKSAWAGNFFEGRRGDALLVAERNGIVGGFLLVLQRGTLGIIDLIALDPSLRGTGAVSALIGAWVRSTPVLERLMVGTQIANTRSLRAYGALGFRVCDASYVLHCHGPTDAGLIGRT